MKTAHAGLTSLILPAALFGVWSCPSALLAQETNRRAIEQTIAKYAKSVDAADTTLATQIWSDSPDVSFIHPRGHEHGLAQIKENVYVRAMGDAFSERKLTVKDINIHVYGQTAWAEFYWDFVAKLKKDGAPVNTKGRETQIYRKEHGEWRLVHVHYSGMPVSEARQGF